MEIPASLQNIEWTGKLYKAEYRPDKNIAIITVLLEDSDGNRYYASQTLFPTDKFYDVQEVGRVKRLFGFTALTNEEFIRYIDYLLGGFDYKIVVKARMDGKYNRCTLLKCLIPGTPPELEVAQAKKLNEMLRNKEAQLKTIAVQNETLKKQLADTQYILSHYQNTYGKNNPLA